MKKIIALDAGTQTGIAIYNSDTQKFEVLKTTDFWKAHDFILQNYTPDTAQIVIEVPNSKRKIYARLDNTPQGAYRERIAANVGSARREAELLSNRFESLGFDVSRVTPSTRKWNAQMLAKRAGISERTSQHCRDAVKLIFER